MFASLVRPSIIANGQLVIHGQSHPVIFLFFLVSSTVVVVAMSD
jgi:hypothetical protein